MFKYLFELQQDFPAGERGPPSFPGLPGAKGHTGFQRMNGAKVEQEAAGEKVQKVILDLQDHQIELLNHQDIQ